MSKHKLTGLHVLKGNILGRVLNFFWGGIDATTLSFLYDSDLDKKQSESDKLLINTSRFAAVQFSNLILVVSTHCKITNYYLTKSISVLD